MRMSETMPGGHRGKSEQEVPETGLTESGPVSHPHCNLGCPTSAVLSGPITWLVNLSCQPIPGKESAKPSFHSNALP